MTSMEVLTGQVWASVKEVLTSAKEIKHWMVLHGTPSNKGATLEQVSYLANEVGALQAVWCGACGLPIASFIRESSSGVCKHGPAAQVAMRAPRVDISIDSLFLSKEWILCRSQKAIGRLEGCDESCTDSSEWIYHGHTCRGVRYRKPAEPSPIDSIVEVLKTRSLAECQDVLTSWPFQKGEDQEAALRHVVSLYEALRARSRNPVITGEATWDFSDYVSKAVNAILMGSPSLCLQLIDDLEQAAKQATPAAQPYLIHVQTVLKEYRERLFKRVKDREP